MESQDTGNDTLTARFWKPFASRGPTVSAGALIVDGQTQFVLILDRHDGHAPEIEFRFDDAEEFEAFVRSVKAAAEL